MTDDTTPSTSPSEAPPPVAAGRPGRLPELSPRTMWLTAAAIAVLTAAAVVLLWWPATAGLTGDQLVSNRLDAPMALLTCADPFPGTHTLRSTVATSVRVSIVAPKEGTSRLMVVAGEGRRR